MEYDFDLNFADDGAIDVETYGPNNEDQRLLEYIRRVAQHMGMDAADLHRQILKEWAYSRSFKEVS